MLKSLKKKTLREKDVNLLLKLEKFGKMQKCPGRANAMNLKLRAKTSAIFSCAQMTFWKRPGPLDGPSSMQAAPEIAS